MAGLMDLKARVGSTGGTTTFQRYGADYMIITGAKGGRPRSLTLSQIRQQAVASENKEKGGISVEGDITGTSTATMKKLLKLRIMGRERSTLSPEN